MSAEVIRNTYRKQGAAAELERVIKVLRDAGYPETTIELIKKEANA